MVMTQSNDELNENDEWRRAFGEALDEIHKTQGQGRMKLFTGTDKEWERAPAGTHAGWCTAVIDLGVQYSERYDSSQQKVRIEWELSEERQSTGEVFLVGREYNNFVTLSGNSIFKRTLEAWRGQPFDADGLASFDIANLLGKPCMLTLMENVGANGKTYTNVEGVTAVPKGLVMAAVSSEPFLFDFETRDPATWLRLPGWLQQRCEKATNWQQKGLLTAAEADKTIAGDVIPF